MKVHIDDLKQTAKEAIASYGYNQKEVEIILDILMFAQLRGNNQGLVKLIGNGIPKDEKAGPTKILKDTKLSTLIDGNHNFGMIIMMEVLETLLTKSRQNGFAIVGTNNTASSTGAIGYYARKIAQENLIGFVFAGSPEAINHHGSIEPKYGTNPIAIGVPTQENPVVLDMATAAIAWFGLVEAKTAGRTIPDSVAINQAGEPTEDPEEAMQGAILPFDKSYKGSGLAMMVEILTGPLVGATFVGIGKGDWGNLMFAIDPELLGDIDEFKSKMSQMVQNVKQSTKAKGADGIFVPGERGDKLTQKRVKSGDIEIEDNLYNELKKVAAR